MSDGAGWAMVTKYKKFVLIIMCVLKFEKLAEIWR